MCSFHGQPFLCPLQHLEVAALHRFFAHVFSNGRRRGDGDRTRHVLSSHGQSSSAHERARARARLPLGGGGAPPPRLTSDSRSRARPLAPEVARLSEARTLRPDGQARRAQPLQHPLPGPLSKVRHVHSFRPAAGRMGIDPRCSTLAAYQHVLLFPAMRPLTRAARSRRSAASRVRARLVGRRARRRRVPAAASAARGGARAGRARPLFPRATSRAPTSTRASRRPVAASSQLPARLARPERRGPLASRGGRARRPRARLPVPRARGARPLGAPRPRVAALVPLPRTSLARGGQSFARARFSASRWPPSAARLARGRPCPAQGARAPCARLEVARQRRGGGRGRGDMGSSVTATTSAPRRVAPTNLHKRVTACGPRGSECDRAPTQHLDGRARAFRARSSRHPTRTSPRCGRPSRLEMTFEGAQRGRGDSSSTSTFVDQTLERAHHIRVLDGILVPNSSTLRPVAVDIVAMNGARRAKHREVRGVGQVLFAQSRRATSKGRPGIPRRPPARRGPAFARARLDAARRLSDHRGWCSRAPRASRACPARGVVRAAPDISDSLDRLFFLMLLQS